MTKKKSELFSGYRHDNFTYIILFVNSVIGHDYNTEMFSMSRTIKNMLVNKQ